jgi:hypothetical protein
MAADGVQFRPASLATTDERAVLASARGLLAPALLWRVKAMRAQVPPHPAPIPVLIARPDFRPLDGACLSCGESLAHRVSTRCSLCVLAAWIALESYPIRVLA